MKVEDVDLNKYIEIIDIKIIQKELCELLYEFHKICEENNLIYNLYGGTLLGAVRHQGMIPWDDDIDVSMPRGDYEKFIKIVENSELKDKYKVYTYPQKNYIYPFMKFCRKDTLLLEDVKEEYNKIALYVDIFPIDGCAKDENERAKIFNKLEKLKKKRCICVGKIDKAKTIGGKFLVLLRRLRVLCYGIARYKRYLKAEIDISKKYGFEESEFVCCIAASWFEKGIVSKSDYLNRKLYEFGKYNFWGMNDYHDHLTNIYGDYMTPPPEQERVNKHNYHLYFEAK